MESLQLLLVDDDPMMHEMIRHYLAEMNFEITIAKDGYEAIACISEKFYDLIILDFAMPYFNGLQVLKKVQGRPSFEDTPVIVLSSENEKDKVFKFFEHGISDYIIKPPRKEDFVKRITKVLTKNLVG